MAREIAGVPPVLVAAVYSAEALSLQLVFDRPIDVSRIAVSAFSVRDGDVNHELYLGHGTAVLSGDRIVTVPLMSITSVPVPGTVLSASIGNGIVAVGGGAWAGISSLPLPLP